MNIQKYAYTISYKSVITKNEDDISTKVMAHSASSIISLSDTDLIEQLALM